MKEILMTNLKHDEQHYKYQMVGLMSSKHKYMLR